MALGHSFASASARPSRIPELPPHACSHAPPARRSDIMLTQMNTPKPSAVCRMPYLFFCIVQAGFPGFCSSCLMREAILCFSLSLRLRFLGASFI